jgi:thioredoxin-related protein
MSVRLKFLFFVPLFIILSSSAMAEDNNYFNHTKYFFLCSYTRQCSYCESCNKEFYKVKIQNNLDKRIKSVTYKYYCKQYKHWLSA